MPELRVLSTRRIVAVLPLCCLLLLSANYCQGASVAKERQINTEGGLIENGGTDRELFHDRSGLFVGKTEFFRLEGREHRRRSGRNKSRSERQIQNDDLYQNVDIKQNGKTNPFGKNVINDDIMMQNGVRMKNDVVQKADVILTDDVMLRDDVVMKYDVTDDCLVSPADYIWAKQLIQSARSNKSSVHLLRYELIPHLDGTASESSAFKRDNTTGYYRPQIWYRTFSKHGQLLLTLPFSYEALSLNLLGAGMKRVDVKMIDSRPGCFRQLSHEAQIGAMRRMLIHDFIDVSSPQFIKGELQQQELAWLVNDNHLCNQKIQVKEDSGKFTVECCHHHPVSKQQICSDVTPDAIMRIVYFLLGLMRIVVILFGPLILQRLVFGSDSSSKTSYIVPLESDLSKTILVKRVKVEDGIRELEGPESGQRRRDMKRFREFRQLVKSIPSDEIVTINFKRLDVTVEERMLLSESCAPVGLLALIYDTLINCCLARVEPFKSCCLQSICGSWSPRFLWVPLKKRPSDCNESCRESCGWLNLFSCAGYIIFMLLLPIPYYARLWFYYQFEKEEMRERKDALDIIDKDYTVDRNVFQWLAPKHAILVLTYIVYILSFLLIGVLRFLDRDKVGEIFRGCMSDMKRVSFTDCLKLLLAHALLPLEKFGLFGIFCGVIYWPLVLPICLVIALFYCIPTLYIIGRFIVPSRPECLQTRPLPSNGMNYPDVSISLGVNSFESCLLLDKISPNEYSSAATNSPQKKKPTKLVRRRCHISLKSILETSGNSLIGIVMAACLLSLMLLYAEAAGVFLEVVVMTILGAVLNADRVVIYVVLIVWCALYIFLSLRLTYKRYADLSKQVFSLITERLSNMMEFCGLTKHQQGYDFNMAFKFFSNEQLNKIKADSRNELNNFSLADTLTTKTNVDQTKNERTKSKMSSDAEEERSSISADSIEYNNNKLHWRISGLVLFVDKNNTQRIPRELYRRICEANLPGSPGCPTQALLKALGRILAALSYMSFLFFAVHKFADLYEVSTTNQTMLVSGFGSFPLIVYWLLTGVRGRNGINTAALKVELQNIILSYSRSWPVHDLSYTRTLAGQLASGEEGDTNVGSDGNNDTTRLGNQSEDLAPRNALRENGDVEQGNGPRRLRQSRHDVPTPQINNNQVDLLITIRDEDDMEQEDNRITAENIRSDHSSTTNLYSNPLNRTRIYHPGVMEERMERSSDVTTGLMNTQTNNPRADPAGVVLIERSSGFSPLVLANLATQTSNPDLHVQSFRSNPNDSYQAGDQATMQIRNSANVSTSDQSTKIRPSGDRDLKPSDDNFQTYVKQIGDERPSSMEQSLSKSGPASSTVPGTEASTLVTTLTSIAATSVKEESVDMHSLAPSNNDMDIRNESSL